MASFHGISCSVDDLQVGMKLASPIYDLNGKMLLGINVCLSEKHILLLQRMMISEVEIWSKSQEAEKQKESKEENPLGLPEIPKVEEALVDKEPFNLARLQGNIAHHILEELVEEILAFADPSQSLLRCVFFHPRQSPYIFHHSLHVTLFTVLIAKQCNFTNDRLKKLILSALLHDVGKLRVSLDVLGKKEPLSDAEKEEVRLHSLLGFRFLQRQHAFDMPVLMGVLQHHERLDGSGYPLHTHSEKTHVFARIIAIADVYDAMTSQKSYGVQHNPFAALIEIRRDMAEGRLDADYGRAFLTVMRANLLGEWVELSDGRFCQLVGWGQDTKRLLYLQSLTNERIVLTADSLLKPVQIIPPQFNSLSPL